MEDLCAQLMAEPCPQKKEKGPIVVCGQDLCVQLMAESGQQKMVRGGGVGTKGRIKKKANYNFSMDEGAQLFPAFMC